MYRLIRHMFNDRHDNNCLAVWLGGNALASINVLTTSDPVSTRMGDHLWVGKLARYVTSQLGRLSLLPSVGC